jgi:NADH-quinone oxidoreductase subunit L
MAVGAAIGLSGIFLAWQLWSRHRGVTAQLITRLRPLYALSHNKWYFDEIIDALFVRPAAWVGRFAQQTFERVVVNGALVGGASLIVRAGSAAVRAAQSGLLRSYAALLLLGVGGVALYFLLQS